MTSTTHRLPLFPAIGLLVLLVAACAPNLEVRKDQSAALRDEGLAYMDPEIANFSIALSKLKDAEKLYADDHLLQTYMGIAYFKKGHVADAIDHFERALEIQPDFAYALNNLGVAYMADRQWEKAIACFSQLVNSVDMFYSTPQYALYNLGLAYHNLSQYPAAEKYYRGALKEDQKSDPSFTAMVERGLGNTLIARGTVADGVRHLEKAAELVPTEAEIRYDLALAYESLNKLFRAVQAYEQVVAIDPESLLATQARKRIRRIKGTE